MTDDMQGSVRAVVTTTQGGVGLSWTGTTLTVDDAADFPRDGGQFTVEGLGGTVYAYTEVIDGEDDDAPDTITTVDAAPSGLPEQFRLDMWPMAVLSVAEVVLPESLEDTVPAIIPHALKPYLDDGVREPEDQESVLIGQRDLAWVVVDLLDQAEVTITEITTSVSEAYDQAMAAHGRASDATNAAVAAHNAAVVAGNDATAALAAAAAAQDAATTAQTSATDAMMSANGRNSRVTATSAPTGSVNPNTGLPWVPGDTWIRWDGADTRNAVGQWTYTAGGVWQAEKIADAVLASLDLNKLVVVGSARMAQAVVDKVIGDAAFFKSITTDRMVIGPGGNMVPDGGPAADWPLVGYSGTTWNPRQAEIDASTSLPHPNRVTMYVDQSVTAMSNRLRMKYAPTSEMIPIQGGNQYRGSWRARRINGVNTAVRTGIYWYDKSNTYISASWGTTYNLTNNDYVEVFVLGTAPLNAAFATLNFATTGAAPSLFAAQPDFRPAVTGTLVVDGSIEAKAIKADSFTGYTFTGSIFQTEAAANRGVEIDVNGLRAYDNSGNLTVQLAGSGGSIAGVTITGGTFQTDGWRVGPRVYIDSASGGRVLFQDAYATELMALQSNTSGESEFRIRDYTGDTTTGQLRVRLRASDGMAFYSPTGVQQGRILGEASRLSIVSNERISMRAKYLTLGYSGDASSEVQIDGNYRVLLTQGSIGSISLNGNGIYQTSTWQQFTISGPASPRNAWAFRPVTVGGINRAMLYYLGGTAGMPSTTIAANLTMSTDGGVWLSTSARRFKRDIQDIGVDPYLVLDVPVRDWVDATAVADDAAYDTRTPGVVAEEVEEVGLAQFVTYGADGQTSGVMYDRLPLLLIPVVRDLRARLERLENNT